MFRKRNPHAAHPIMRKGGVHTQSKTGQRTRDHCQLLDEAAECLGEYLNRDESEDLVGDMKGERDAPFSFLIYIINSPVKAFLSGAKNEGATISCPFFNFGFCPTSII